LLDRALKAVLDAQEALQTEEQDPGVPAAWSDYQIQHLAVPVVHVEMLENMEEEHSGVTRPSSRSR
jgi:hypothetical protein